MPMFESSSTRITLDIPSAASTKSCPTLFIFNKGSRTSIVNESTLCSTHTPRFSRYKQAAFYDKKKLPDTAAGGFADLDTIISLVSGPNIPDIWQKVLINPLMQLYCSDTVVVNPCKKMKTILDSKANT
jgi:hypothetical protein